ncbi:porin [Rhodoferax sp.]|uniref:porin n=1 Tax=Rhodoferax sp. TaxID=50421 RepID=UPI002621C0D6|nr:porin [Rhodoferax sp.]MDD2927162.1 porin [Rhodoferax sp.]
MTHPFIATQKFSAVRSIAMASALCCAGLASAQTGPGVTLYGLADAGITSVSGLKAGTVTQVASGIMEGSRWGIKGTEDMGGGYKTIFTLESRVELDTGSVSSRPISGTQLSDRYSQAALLGLPTTLQPAVAAVDGLLAAQWGVNPTGNLFDRQAYVGVITPVGAIMAGRMYTPAFETNAMYDIMETQSGLSAGQVVAFPAALEIRKSNALQYRFVKDGISGSFMYALGEVAGDTGKGRMLGLNANYKTGNFSVGFGYNQANNELGQSSLTTSVLGASMNFGQDKLTGMVIKLTDDNPNGLSAIAPALTPVVGAAAAGLVQNAFLNAFKQDGTLSHIGYRHVTGPHAISVAYTAYKDNRPANADVTSYGVAYTYSLSKRTDLNAVVVQYDNKNLAQTAPGGNGYIGGVTASAGTGSTGLAFGIRHRF